MMVEAHLISAHKHSAYEKGQDGCPHFVPKKGLCGLHDHWTISKQISKPTGSSRLILAANIWGLCQALWGQLPIEGISHFNVF